MNKERLGSLPEEAGETTPDEQLKRETEMLELMAETTPFGYPPTRYRTTHPDTVSPSEIAHMNDEEFNDFLVALDWGFRLSRYPQKRSTIITALTNQLAKIFYTAGA